MGKVWHKLQHPMNNSEPFDLAQKVADLRRRQGLSQRELATQINRSESWVSQVERGVLSVERLSVLQALAGALAVPVQDLQPATKTTVEPTPSDLQGLRLTLTGHPALSTLLTSRRNKTITTNKLKARVEDAWTLTHASRFAELSKALSTLIPDLERAWRSTRRATG